MLEVRSPAVADRKRQLKWWERPQEALAKSRFGGWVALNVANPLDQRLLERTNGRVGFLFGQSVGLLYTVGAKSGQPRKTPLLYHRSGERIVLVASQTGKPKNPAWYYNVTAHPAVEFLPRGGPRGRYVAREAKGAEREELWAEANDHYSGFDDYAELAGGRVIPVSCWSGPRAEPASRASARR